MLIGITGKARHGKDTVGNLLTKNYLFVRVAYADALKDYVNGSGMVSREDIENKSEHYRSVLQAVGHAMRELVDQDYWVKKLWSSPRVAMHLANADIVVTDVRYPNEAHWVQQAGGYIVRVVRVDDSGRPMTLLGGSRGSFPSEVSMDDYDVDHEIRIPDGELKLLEQKLNEWMLALGHDEALSNKHRIELGNSEAREGFVREGLGMEQT